MPRYDFLIVIVSVNNYYIESLTVFKDWLHCNNQRLLLISTQLQTKQIIDK
jgi:hypothetical protein